MGFYQGDSGGPLVQRSGNLKAVGDKWIQVRIGPGLRFIICKFRLKGLASYCKAETTFTFHFFIINA